MNPTEFNLKREIGKLQARQALPLDQKIRLSEMKIKEWYGAWQGEVYVAFSGGKDSTVLLHLVRSIYPRVVGLFCDTGLEFPEIKTFVKQTPNIITVKPEKTFRRVLKEEGYPVVSKQVAAFVRKLRGEGCSDILRKYIIEGITSKGKKSPYGLSKKWHYLENAPFAISEKCCDIMKKKPAKRFEKETGKKGFVGTLATEGRYRKFHYLRTGCNSYKGSNPHSTPLAFWREEDIWAYLREYNVPYSSIYDMGYSRTGCVFCMFGAHLEKEPNRFQRLESTHPNLHRYCIKVLGLDKILDYLKISYKDRQGKLPF